MRVTARILPEHRKPLLKLIEKYSGKIISQTENKIVFEVSPSAEEKMFEEFKKVVFSK